MKSTVSLRIIFFLFLSTSFFLNRVESKTFEDKKFTYEEYKGLTIFISESTQREMEDLWLELGEVVQKALLKQKLTPKKIAYELKNRYTEMVAIFEKNKGLLPVCLKVALECFFKGLKDGSINATIEWEINKLDRARGEMPYVSNYLQLLPPDNNILSKKRTKSELSAKAKLT